LSPFSVPSAAPHQVSISASAALWSLSVRIRLISIGCFLQYCDIVKVSTRSYSACVPMKLHEGHLSAEVESDRQAVVSCRNVEPDALAVQHLGFRSCSLDSHLFLRWLEEFCRPIQQRSATGRFLALKNTSRGVR
jgi:hypothetical protein